MKTTIIFDLSEVLIYGLFGIENQIGTYLNIERNGILKSFGGILLHDLCCGKISEEEYLIKVIQLKDWNITTKEVKQIIRDNFHRKVPDMENIISIIRDNYELVLLSDHAKEWVEYIHEIHPFINQFDFQFYSYELGQTKREQSTYLLILNKINRTPNQCLFIDDNEGNLNVALSLGIQGILFKNAKKLKAELSSLGILVE
jgi:FMN phosphatase YigB (HAD superfamily)